MKKFLKFFNIFELNLNEKSYKSPLIRIFASLAIMFAVCIFRLNITITSVALNIFLIQSCLFLTSPISIHLKELYYL